MSFYKKTQKVVQMQQLYFNYQKLKNMFLELHYCLWHVSIALRMSLFHLELSMSQVNQIVFQTNKMTQLFVACLYFLVHYF